MTPSDSRHHRLCRLVVFVRRLVSLTAVAAVCGPWLASAQGWQPQAVPALPSGESFDFLAVAAIDANQVWIAGGVLPGTDGGVLKSVDGGATWILASREAGGGLWELSMLSATHGIVAGGFGLYRRTVNGGTTWVAETGPENYVYGFEATDFASVWAVGWDGAGAGVIRHQAAVGGAWSLKGAVSNLAFYGISAASASSLWAVGAQGHIWHSTDGGAGWPEETSPTGSSLNDVVAIDSTTAWAVGDAGTIVKTTNGGATWVLQTSNTTNHLKRIAAASASVAWAVGDNGTILRTIDGGTTWVRQWSGTSEHLTGIAAVDASTAWVVGRNGVILHTTDGGAGTWPAPTITSVSPTLLGYNSTPAETVTITGTGLRGGQFTVRFGATASESVTWVSTTMVRAVAPFGLTGPLDVVVSNEDGQSVTATRAVTALAWPVIRGISPFHGPASTGFQVQVTGHHLATVASASVSVQYDEAPWSETKSASVSVFDAGHVAVTVPVFTEHVPTRATLVLRTAEGQECDTDFVLDPATVVLAIDTVTPAVGAHGTTIVLTGTGFDTAAATVSASGSPLAVVSRSATSIVATMGSGGGDGLLDLTVANPGGAEFTAYKAFLYTTTAAPSVTSVSPAVGAVAGGTVVTIAGTNLTGAIGVTFGGYTAAVVSAAATEVVATTPAHAHGAVDVTVIAADGYQTATRASGFAYVAASVAGRPSRDFDGDWLADAAVYRPSSGTWFSLDSSTGRTSFRSRGWGVAAQGDTPVVGDFDGDGIVDPAVFRPATGTWFILESHAAFSTWSWFGWGASDDTLMPGDYDGDGKTDGAVYRASSGTWYVRPSGGGAQWSVVFGQAGDVPVAGDFDGDLKRDPAVYRASSGTWFWLKSSSGFTQYDYRGWGVLAQGDAPAPGDYDGDGKTDPCVFRPGTGTWFILESHAAYTTWSWFGWGTATDALAPADYDGDGKTDGAVFRSSNGTWYVKPSGGGSPWNVVFGAAGDTPLITIR